MSEPAVHKNTDEALVTSAYARQVHELPVNTNAVAARQPSGLRRMQGRRPTQGALMLITFLAFAVGGGALGRTVAGLANAHGMWFHALRLLGVAIVFGGMYFAVPHRFTTVAETP